MTWKDETKGGNTGRIREYLVDQLEILVLAGDEARLMNCLFCDRARTMKVNVETGNFICFNEDCMEKGRFRSLVMAIEECEMEQATRIIMDLAKGVTRARNTMGNLKERLANKDTPRTEESKALVDHALPDEFVPCWNEKTGKWKIPEYLYERRMRKATLKRWGVGYCEDGQFENRILIPVLCDGSRSFVARRIGRRGGPKYLSPGDGWDDTLLFGYDQITRGARVVAVEGVFDSMRVWSYRHESVAYFGQQLGKHQIDLLVRRGISELVLMPDGTDPRARARALKDAANLSSRFPSVVVALLEDGDPDELPRADVLTALENARPPSGLGDSLRERLANTKDNW